MPSFFEKMKQGATDAARKAQQTVEVTKFRSQISSREKEMERLFRRIGQAVYQGHEAGDVSISEEEVMGCCVQLDEIKQEIAELETRIHLLRSEKTCTCGKVVGADVNFCPACGKRFPEEPRVPDTMGDLVVICPTCKTENDLQAQYCVQCGEELGSRRTAAAPEGDAKTRAPGDTTDSSV